MEQTIKQFYDAPSTTVFEVRQEGVICGSPNTISKPDNYEDGGDPFDF